MRQMVVGLAALVVLVGCADKREVAVVQRQPAASPYADGREHTEPLYYNGRHYAVRFKLDRSTSLFDVHVSGPGRRLGGGEGDRKIVQEVGRNAVNHFACPDSRKGQIVPGTPRHAGGAWTMQARCA